MELNWNQSKRKHGVGISIKKWLVSTELSDEKPCRTHKTFAKVIRNIGNNSINIQLWNIDPGDEQFSPTIQLNRLLSCYLWIKYHNHWRYAINIESMWLFGYCEASWTCFTAENSFWNRLIIKRFSNQRQGLLTRKIYVNIYRKRINKCACFSRNTSHGSGEACEYWQVG